MSDEAEEATTAEETAAPEEDAPEESEVEDTEAESEEPTGLQAGDFIEIGYTARTVDGGQLVDTTDPEVADEEGVGDQGTFEPRVIVLGEGHLFEAVGEEIIGGTVGDTGSVIIPAAEAFGEYDESEVRTVSANKIPDDSRRPGAQVQIDGEQGYLETIIGGRARVDFNHPLAGEAVEYDYEILGEVTDQLERAQGLFDMFLDIDLEMWIEQEEVEETSIEDPAEEDDEPETVTEMVEKTSLYSEATPQLSMNQQWMFQKQQIGQQIMQLTGIDRIVIEEVIDGSGGMGMPGMMGGMGGMGGAGEIEE